MSAIRTLVERLHGVKETAKQLGVSPQLIYFCLSGDRKFPEDKCPVAEKLTDGDVRCEHLRPDVAWARVDDPDWRHGRPLIDVSAQAN
jgi:DNA-binding transcriptional regulator YdaS (Cro superfamily)